MTTIKTCLFRVMTANGSNMLPVRPVSCQIWTISPVVESFPKSFMFAQRLPA